MNIDIAPGAVLIAITAVLAFLLLAEPGPLAMGMRFVFDTIPMTREWPFRGEPVAWLGAVALAVSICWVAMSAYWALGLIELHGEDQTWGFVILCAATYAWTALVLDQLSDLSKLRLQKVEAVLLARVAKRWPDLTPEGEWRWASLGDLVHLLLRAERRAAEEGTDEDAWYRSLVEGIF